MMFLPTGIYLHEFKARRESFLLLRHSRLPESTEVAASISRKKLRLSKNSGIC